MGDNAAEADTPPERPPRGPDTAHGFHKKEVVDKTMRNVGRVDDLYFDHDGWRLTHLAVKLDREVCKQHGLSRLFSRTCYLPVEMVETVGDRLLLNVTVDTVVEQAEIA